MISKTVTFEDYEGTEHTQTFYFNMTKDEVVRWQLDPDGGLLNHLKLIIAEKNQKELMRLFAELIDRTYGVKAVVNGVVGHVKNAANLEAFKSTPAYTEIFMDLATDAEAGAAFIKGIFPKSILPEDFDEKAKAAIESL